MMARARQLSDEMLKCWTVVLASHRINMRYTNTELGARFASRISGAVPGVRQRHDFTFDLLEAASLGWPSPADWSFWHDNRDDLHQQLARERLGALIPDHAPGIEFPFMFFDPDACHGVVLAHSIDDLPGWVGGAPFAYLLHLALAAKGSRLIHAGTLGGQGGGALVIGDQGAGKSATTLSGVIAGLSSVGDDFIAVSLDPAPTAWPVYAKFKQSPAGLARFPKLEPKTRNLPLNWRGKIEFDPDVARHQCMAPRLQLKSILIPQVSHLSRTEIEPAPPTAVFSLIAQSLMPALPGARLAGFSFLTRLTRILPGYWLRLSSDPEEVGTRVRDLLDQVPP